MWETKQQRQCYPEDNRKWDCSFNQNLIDTSGVSLKGVSPSCVALQDNCIMVRDSLDCSTRRDLRS